MGEKWFEGLPDDMFRADIDRIYEHAFARIRAGLAQGLDFDSASDGIDVSDEELRKTIVDDMLKVMIAEEHFAKRVSLEVLAARLKIPADRLAKAKHEMFEDIEKSAVESFYRDEGAGNA